MLLKNLRFEEHSDKDKGSKIEIYDDLGTKKTLDNKNLYIRGLDKGDLALPTPSKSNASYCLLQEYFAFEKKFHFFTLDGFNLNINLNKF